MEPSDDMLPFQLTIRAGSEELHLQGTVPAGDIPLVEVVPMLQQLDDLIVEAAVREIEERGEEVSCGPGCGACCRQLVPISEAEAEHLASVVDRMPPARRRRVSGRFETAMASLERHGMLDRLRSWEGVPPPEELHEIGLDYYRLGIPCPFLERESCGIHPDRPLICREYIVTSPPANCATPNRDSVARVAIPTLLSSFLLTFCADPDRANVNWLPLVAALARAEPHRNTAVSPGPAIVEALVRHLARH